MLFRTILNLELWVGADYCTAVSPALFINYTKKREICYDSQRFYLKFISCIYHRIHPTLHWGRFPHLDCYWFAG